MANEGPTTFLTTREAHALADSLSQFGGRHSLAALLAARESQCRTAARLIRAMLRQTHDSDVFQLPPEA